MRPAGGYTTDMINYGQSADIFRAWAEMVVFDELRTVFNGPHTYCLYTGRRDEANYVLSFDQVKELAGSRGKLHAEMHNAMSVTMGNQASVTCFDTKEEMMEFVNTVLELKD